MSPDRPRRLVAAAAVTTLLSGMLSGCGGLGGFGGGQPSQPPSTHIRKYVALGDGFTAAPYTGKTADDGGCLRSDANYPSLVGKDLGLDKVTDVSCAGAQTKDLTGAASASEGREKHPAQVKAVTADTDLVTVGVGIEDAGLLDKLWRVCSALPCDGKPIGNDLLATIHQTGKDLLTALRDVQAQAPKSLIVVVGYPTLLPAAGNCAALPTLDRTGHDIVATLLRALDHELRTAAMSAGASYIDVGDLSKDHDPCSSEPWVNGKRDQPGKALAYHPKAAEQRAIAEAVVAEARAG